MKRPRRNHSAAFKAKVALAAIRGDQTLIERAEPPPQVRSPGSLLTSLSRRQLTFLAVASGALCAVLAFTRPDGGWEWVPAIAGLAFFGTLAGRRITHVPYHNTLPALALVVVIPGYHVISAFNRGRAHNLPELAIDRAIQVEPAWMLVYGSVCLASTTFSGDDN